MSIRWVGPHRYWLAGFLLALVLAPVSLAKEFKTRHSLDVSYYSAVGFEEDRADASRLEISPEFQVRFGSGWQADVDLRFEAAGADTGLGTEDTFDDLSQPLILGPDARIEIDQATLSHRKRSRRITLGKQTLAWGVLDGLQVTDRFDAVRRRDAVFTEHRPERISRWGVRAEFEWAETRWDAAVFLDGTADQLAQPGDTFAVRAPRYRAGLPEGTPLPDLVTDISDDPTIGLRASRRFGASDVSLLVIHGPDTEPVFRLSETSVSLEYDTRTLLGATWQKSDGPRVFRLEAAWIGDQPVNMDQPVLATDTRQRWLAGVGLDWDMPDGAFLNAQIGADHIAGAELVRPSTDVIATLKFHKLFANDTWKASAELIGSLSDGDGTFRPSVSWQVNDFVRIQAGADIVWGDEDGIFGQFDGTDRAWLKFSYSV